MSIQVLRHSHFPSDPWGDGGSKRTAQITEILDRHQIQQEFYDPDITKIFQKKFAVIEGVRLLNQHKIKSSLTKTALTQLGFNYYKRQKTMAHYAENHSLLLWESSRQQNYLMSYAARDNGIAVIGLPHNLESLVAGQYSDFTGLAAPWWFEEELQSLRMCNLLFTISREEQYLLKLFGLKAEFLPYHPPSEVASYLKSIRKRRENQSPSSIIFLMGTAGNKPTFDGMLNRIRFFDSISQLIPDAELHIGGYLTEMLKPHLPDNPRILLHGSLSVEQMDDLLTRCRYCWIHQNISTGSLTKIPELMMAGVPVLLNSDAARNFYNVPGIRVYENDEDCRDAMLEILPIPPEPKRPEVHERILVQAITELYQPRP